MDIKVINKPDLNEKIYYKKLDTGLDLYYIPKEGYSKQYAIFATDYGSVDNEFVPIGGDQAIEVPQGIAHFLEHKLFEEPEENIFDKFSELGASVNAFTGFNQTAYLFSSTENFYEALEALVKFVQNPHFTDENVEKEKGIIAQEIKMYEDDPGWRVFFNCLNAMYFDHPVKIDIAGTVESISKISKEDLYTCYNTFYHPENMVLFVVGDLDFEEIVKTVEDSQRRDYEKLGSIKRIFREEPSQVKTKIVEDNMMTANPIFYIGFKDLDLGHSAREEAKKEMVTNIVLDMLFSSSSKFYNELYDLGLVASNFGAYFSGKTSYGHSFVVGESDNPREVYTRIIDHLKQPVEEILDIRDFERIRNDEIGNFLMSLDSVESIANSGVESILGQFNFLDHLELLNEISFEDIKARLSSHLREENSVISIVNPIK